MTICETNENNYSYNELYEHISYFIQTIEHDSKIRHLTSSCSIVDESETCKMGNKKFNKIKPVFNLNERQILTIDISNYHKECIGIIKLSSIDDNNNNDNKNNNYSRAKMRYLIESDSKNNLDIFLNIVEEKSLEYFKKNLLDGQVYYYNYDCINYNSAWNKYKINCVKTYDNIFLEKNIKKNLNDYVSNMLFSDTIYVKLGIPQKIGFLFYGLPGTGKTSTIFALASKINADIYNLNLNVSRSHFINQVKLIPDRSIVCINDIDTLKISQKRENNEDNNDNDKKRNTREEKIDLGFLLEILDGYCYFKKCIIIMTTNHINKLDPALIRSGRIDHKFEFKLASHYQIKEIIKYCYNHDLKNYELKKIPEYVYSTSELINTIIAPNLSNLRAAISQLITTHEINDNSRKNN